MGCVQSTEDPESQKVTQALKQDKKEDSAVKKLLFLGAGGSGKSTIFKQLRTLHGGGYQEADRVKFKEHIFGQVLEQMLLALECIDILKDEQPEEYKKVSLSEDGQSAAERLQSSASLVLTQEMANLIEQLWSEKAIKYVYDHRATMKIEDTCAYFWDDIQRIAAPHYVPTPKDMLLVRYRTTGVIDQKFQIKNNVFHVFDVGGQKSERKKWIHCFEHVTAVIFVASLSCYDEVMFEDEDQNAMVDSIQLFDSTCNNEYFKKISMILFLNKSDLFADKIKTVPITVCPRFVSYAGSATDYVETTDYIKDMFEDVNQNENRAIFPHLTCAVDKGQVKKVFDDVQTTIINDALAQGGLIGSI